VQYSASVTRPTTPDVASVLRVLAGAGRALVASEIKQALQEGGFAKAEVDKAWSGLQKRIKAHPLVVPVGKAYRWATPQDDLFTSAESAESEARQRQERIDAIRMLAELAGEVEELLANETEPDVMIRQVRAWVMRSGLNPVGRAGEQTKFDRKVHRPIDGPIRDGATVFVVRPGYVWKASDQEVLIGKAVVEE